MTYSARAKAVELRRELHYRKRLYPRWVAEGKMKGDQADYRIDVMEEIARDYERQAELEPGHQEKLL